MSSVGSSSSLLSLVKLNMSDNKFLKVKLLSLGIILKILNQSQEIFNRFFWPSSLSPSELSSLSSSSNTSIESHEWNTLLMLKNLSEILSDLINCLSFHHLGSLVGILEVAWNLISRGLGMFLSLWLNRVIGHRL